MTDQTQNPIETIKIRPLNLKPVSLWLIPLVAGIVRYKNRFPNSWRLRNDIGLNSTATEDDPRMSARNIADRYISHF